MKRRKWKTALLFLCGSLALLSRPAAAEVTPAAWAHGSWEGFLAETPARLTLISVELGESGEGWTGTVTLPGTGALPLSSIQVSGMVVHFKLVVGEDAVDFKGTYDGETLRGEALEGESRYGLELWRNPTYPPPENRVEAWRQDLEAARNRFLRYDRSFDPASRVAFASALTALERSLASMNDQQIIVALSRAVAGSGNAHTRLYLLRNRTELSRLPVRLSWFEEGLFVVRATGHGVPALGCRVEAIGGHHPGMVRDEVAGLFAGNKSWIDYKSPYFMTSPEILYGLGLIPDMQQVPMTFSCPGNKALDLRLAPLPLERSKEPTEDWRALSPVWQPDGHEWKSLLTEGKGLPLYLRHPDLNYWFDYLEPDKTLYLQYNRSQDMDEGASFSDFAEDVTQFVRVHPIDRFILDLRFNTGGNNGIAAPFLEALADLDAKGAVGKLFVITGRATFSAGISHAAFLRQHSTATFVGEPVGDDLDTWSEGGNIVLPNSGLTLHFTNGFHSLSSTPHPEFEAYLWSDLDLETLAPHIPVYPSFAAYRDGRDAALQAILQGVQAEPPDRKEGSGAATARSGSPSDPHA